MAVGLELSHNNRVAIFTYPKTVEVEHIEFVASQVLELSDCSPLPIYPIYDASEVVGLTPKMLGTIRKILSSYRRANVATSVIIANDNFVLNIANWVSALIGMQFRFVSTLDEAKQLIEELLRQENGTTIAS